MAFRDPVLVRRARRRRRLVAFTVVALVITVLALAFRYQSERRLTIDYLNEASSIAEDHQEMSLLFEDLFSLLGVADREEILTRLDGLVEQVAAVGDRVDALVVTPTVAEVNGSLVVAHRAWKNAIDLAPTAIVAVLDQPEDERNGDRQLQSAFIQLLVGDQSYVEVLRELRAIEVDFNAFPEFAYVGSEREALYDAAAVGDRLRGTRSLGESHDLAVVVTLEPEPAGDRDGILVIPNTGSFSVLAVASNNGNVQETGIEVQLELIPASGEPLVFNELVAALEAGEAVSVDFRELEIEVGVAYELRLTVTVAEDGDLSNNRTELFFSINSDS